MCGIVAFFSDEKPLGVETLRRGTDQIQHRGPDGTRHWLSPSGRVGLGHVRLSIIDLTTGDQPISSADGSKQLVVNGEFYDFVRIRTELEAKGYVFKTKSDSEIALHLYEEYGAQALQQLRGEFAITLWDERAQTLFAARDRFGIKPLFYAKHEGVLYLASEIKSLLAAGVPARWDHESFYMANHFMTFAQDRTLFEGINQIPPGHYLIATRGNVRLVRYWDFNYPRVDDPKTMRSEQDYVEQYRNVLDEAVRLRLHADVPVGCYLSGGLDSCSLLGMASRHVSRPIRAFTLSFDQADYDEASVAEEMAAHCGAEFNRIPMTSAILADHFPRAIWNSETLFLNPHGIAKFLLSRAVRDAGYKVVLTGEGSDELLGGYVHFRRDMLLHNTEGQDPVTVARLLQLLRDNNKVSRGLLISENEGAGLKSAESVLGFTPSWFEAFESGSKFCRSYFSSPFQSEFAGRDAFRSFLDSLEIEERVVGREPVNQALYLWSKIVLPNYLLTVLGDRMEMAHSIEGRVPFLDHKVVETACQLPVSLKIRGITEKYILREAAKPFITKTVYERQKHPFFAPPLSSSPSEPLFELMQDTLRGRGMAKQPFFDQKKVVDALDRSPQLTDKERVALDTPLMMMLSTCILQDQFKL